MEDALKGIRVLEVAQWWFVPAAGAILRDWGADVIKIEHPVTGDPQRGLAAMGLTARTGGVDFMMQQSNRGKRSVGIDLATPGGVELLYRLAEGSDVFLTSFLPAARRRLRIDVEHIRARNPNIIYVRGSGHGPRGPHAERPGYDATAFWSRGGIGHGLTPPGAEAPVTQRAAFGDSMGAMTLAGGISAALFRRERTGTPSVVDVSLLSTAMWVMGPDVVASKLVKPGKGGGLPSFSRKNAPNPLVNSYRTGDGRWILFVMLQADRFWEDFCKHIGRPDLAEDARFTDGKSRFENREACVAEIDATLAKHTLAEWTLRLDGMEGAWAPMQSALEIHDDPQTIANEYLREIEQGDGKRFKLVANPVQFDERPPELGPSPELGQNTEEVLLELGLSWDEISEHKQAGAIS